MAFITIIKLILKNNSMKKSSISTYNIYGLIASSKDKSEMF